MSLYVEQKIDVNVPVSQIWDVLKDFSSIQNFSATVDKSPLLQGPTSGLGTRRKCYFYDNTSVVEEIVDYQEGQGFRFIASEFSLPLKSLEGWMGVTSIDEQRSRLTMSLNFEPKFGFLGVLMGNLMMKPMMNKMLTKILKGLVYHAKTGKKIEKVFPSEQEISALLD
jgi:hypothetical protein